mmetsp:Transcript_14557/g.25914  ORF Transcript_14557/g.25914 Transcript_14557/m.25914 type:complete len:212 (+) Transcript_14557:2732-3367(+)
MGRTTRSPGDTLRAGMVTALLANTYSCGKSSTMARFVEMNLKGVSSRPTTVGAGFTYIQMGSSLSGPNTMPCTAKSQTCIVSVPTVCTGQGQAVVGSFSSVFDHFKLVTDLVEIITRSPPVDRTGAFKKYERRAVPPTTTPSGGMTFEARALRSMMPSTVTFGVKRESWKWVARIVRVWFRSPRAVTLGCQKTQTAASVFRKNVIFWNSSQ